MSHACTKKKKKRIAAGEGGVSGVALERRRAARYRHLQRGYARVMCREVGRLERREVKRREAERLGVRPDSSRGERGGAGAR